MTDTITEQLCKKYEKEFDAHFVIELIRPIERITNTTELFKSLNFTTTIPLNEFIIATLYDGECTQALKKAYVKDRLAAAVNFIEKGANDS